MPPPALILTRAKLSAATAEKLIVDEWRRWAKKHGSCTITDMLFFYFGWLQKNKPELLLFPFEGQQWHMVRVWLQRDEGFQVKRRKSQV
jgi:hypothetical protein